MQSLVALLSLVSLAALANAQATCNVTTKCPDFAPCCSEFGFCGSTEAFCLGGCNPLDSTSLDSCKPNPDPQHTFVDNSRVLSNSTFYDGNASSYDWVVESGNIMNTNTSGGELVLILTETNGGTRISSTRYFHYGQVSARLKTGRWGGTVTAFITMSDVKDEIDWEFPGNATTAAQSNYFWQGLVTNPNHGNISNGLSDTFSNYHDYSINWQPDTLTWSIDGKVVRTLNKADTLVNGVYQYPTTPARVQLSLWPAGTSTTSAGTVEWSGGLINWNDPDYVAAGHFYALVSSVNITCNDPTPPAAGVTGYTYAVNSSTNTPGVLFTNTSTNINTAPRLRDMAATGLRSVLGGAVLVGALSLLV
ncbi:unnamed protein product [Mycena citricolor]|uniref:Glycoside hydrolase family 16 protein n=1 Tax=Mycena citricolor TaxID=2018698 RepID=A0AAD2HFP7_9AGAR|nr:unnamed protein product [Mycena citricolor]CAK5274852.1 unnamed protein product [Mycena citricolor]